MYLFVRLDTHVPVSVAKSINIFGVGSSMLWKEGRFTFRVRVRVRVRGV